MSQLFHETVGQLPAMQRITPEPIPVDVDGVRVCEWPPVVPAEDLVEVGAMLLSHAYDAYVSQVAYRRYEETDLDLLRRLAQVIADKRGMNAQDITDYHLRMYGRPGR